MPTEDESVTHVERPVRFHTSLEELKAFLKRRRPSKAGVLRGLTSLSIGSDFMMMPSVGIHFLAQRAMKQIARIARNNASSVSTVRLFKNYGDDMTVECLDILVEAEPLSLSMPEDIDREIEGR